jgi:vitamin B12 transporter
MKGFFINKFVVLILAVLSAGGLFSGPSRAATAEPTVDEQSLMGLYYAEDELVEAPTRFPKPISQVAENVTIVTAEQIEAMHVHTVADVLYRVAGVSIANYRSLPFQTEYILIHGSDYEHVLVLVDGIRWNSVSADSNFTNQIPLRIIRRIEVIKGAASSSWGSALGGVVNIITKDAGKAGTPPTGLVAGSLGENATSDLQAETTGGVGRFGYYLYAGRQKTDGILDALSGDNKSLYGKISVDLPRDMSMVFTVGASDPEYNYLHIPDWDLGAEIDDRVCFYTVGLNAPLGEGINLSLNAHSFGDKYADTGRLLSTGDMTDKRIDDNTTRGIRGRLAVSRGQHTVVGGAEYEHRRLKNMDGLTGYRSAAVSEDIRAIYVNDTYHLDRATFTAGLRYDDLSIADNIISPSLGMTYKLNETTLLRAAVARGFRKPPIPLKQGDPYFHITNPALESERTWTYQAGLETTALVYGRLKGTLFLHDTTDRWVRNPSTWAWENDGKFRRPGLELEFESIPIHNFTLTANGTAVRLEPENREHDTLYNANIILVYDAPRLLQGRISGHYDWWGKVIAPDSWNGNYGTFIWDLTVAKKFTLHQRLDAEVFFSAHNLFNGASFGDEFLPNADRWVEAGFTLAFR